MGEHNTLTSSPEHINMKWGRKWNSIYLKIQDFVSQIHSELIAWYVHTHSEQNLFLGYNIKATRKREVIRPHLWVWTTHFSRIRDKVKELNSQEVRGLKMILDRRSVGRIESVTSKREKRKDWRIYNNLLQTFKRGGLDTVATEAEPEATDENLRKTNTSWRGGRCFCEMCPNVACAASGWSEFPILRDIQGEDNLHRRDIVPSLWSLPNLRFWDTWFFNF